MKIVGRRVAAVDVDLGRVKLVQTARHLLALRLHLRRLLGVLGILEVALRLLLGLLSRAWPWLAAASIAFSSSAVMAFPPPALSFFDRS